MRYLQNLQDNIRNHTKTKQIQVFYSINPVVLLLLWFYLPSMKATIPITFNTTQLKGLFNSLTIADCKQAITFLQKRVQQYEEEKHLKKSGVRNWDDDFFNMRIEEFDLRPWTLKRLRENELLTVRNIADFGVENLSMLMHVGKQITNEIKREIFNNPF